MGWASVLRSSREPSQSLELRAAESQEEPRRAKATLVVPITIYRFAFEHLRLGRGAAAAMILLVFLLSVSAIFIRVIFANQKKQESE